MGAFFIVIIMLVYIFGRCNYEQAVGRQGRKEYEEKQRRKEEAFQTFKRTYTDPVLEKQVKEDTALREKVKIKLQQDLRIYDASQNMITMIAMAEHGKIPEYLTEQTIYVTGWFRTQPFMSYYDKMLRQHGMAHELKVCWHAGASEYGYRSVHDSETQLYGGDYSWPVVYESRMSLDHRVL